MGKNLSVPLTYLIAGRQAAGQNGSSVSSSDGRGGGPSGGGGGGGSSGSGEPKSKVGATMGGTRLQVWYDMHLPALFLQYG